jgi:hypothetical protein
MTDEQELILEMCDPEAIRFDGLDKAIVGYDHNGWIIYDYNTMIHEFTAMGMTDFEAQEWISYNVIGVNAGQGFTIMMMTTFHLPKKEDIKDE